MSASTLIARRPRRKPGRPVRARVGAPLVLAALIGLSLMAAACGGSSSATPPSTKPPAPTTTTSTTAPAITTPTVTINGTTYSVPTESPGMPINPLQDTGQQVVLTSGGFLPRTLYSAMEKPVVFTNLTAKPITLTLTDIPGVAPVVIAPGGSWSWVPNALQFAYRASTGDWGLVEVGAFGY